MEDAGAGEALSAPDRALLRADEERLRVVAAVLARGGTLAIVVADDDVWTASRRFLEASLLGHRFVAIDARTSDETGRAINAPERSLAATTIVLHVARGADEPLVALNLRREDLVKRAANFIVWLRGDEEYARFVRIARDCHSFRDALAIVDGEPAFDPPIEDDVFSRVRNAISQQVAAHDASTEAVLFAEAALDEAARLGQSGGRLKAYRLLDAAIAKMDGAAPDRDERLLLARLLEQRSRFADTLDARKHLGRVPELLAPDEAVFRARIERVRAWTPDALGVAGRHATQSALSTRDIDSLGPSFLALRKLRRTDTVGAHRSLSGIPALFLTQPGKVLGGIFALRSTLSGDWREALTGLMFGHTMSWYNPSADSARSAGYWELDGVLPLWLLHAEGELRAAQSWVRAYSAICPPRARIEAAVVTADAGSVTEALDELARLETTELHFEERVDLGAARASIVDRAVAAHLLDDSARDDVTARLERLQADVDAYSVDQPPWIRIRCQLVRADAYLSRNGGELAAESIAREALALARADARERISYAVRRVVVGALRRGDSTEVHALLDEALAAAEADENRGEVARLLALSVWHAHATGHDPAPIEAKLDEALRTSGSALLEAAVSLQIGQGTGRKDYLSRAQHLYHSFPCPEREGACLEAIGAVEKARVRYRTYGLVLAERVLDHRTAPAPVVADPYEARLFV